MRRSARARLGKAEKRESARTHGDLPRWHVGVVETRNEQAVKDVAGDRHGESDRDAVLRERARGGESGRFETGRVSRKRDGDARRTSCRRTRRTCRRARASGTSPRGREGASEDALVVEREVRLPEEVLGHGREDAARRPVPDRVEEELGDAECVPAGSERRRSAQEA